MRYLPFLPALFVLGSSSALCQYSPYANGGSLAPSTPLTATATGSITGYFYDSAAGGTDYVRLLDVTSGYTSQYLLDNHTTAPGSAVDFGPVTVGDQLVFEIVNSDVETSDGYTNRGNLQPIDPNARTNKYLMASDSAYSFDGINHAYITAFSADPTLGIPAGLFVGMEDLPTGYADLDYNDTEFVFTNVSAVAATPEPGTMALCGTGLLTLMAGYRRKRSL